MKEEIAKLVKVYMEAQSLSESEKEIKEEIKAKGGDAAVCAAVAKSIVNDKVDKLKERAELTVDLIELSRE
ncbi:MAG: hypothetical protein ACRDBG_04430 [Waterburya sp.]